MGKTRKPRGGGGPSRTSSQRSPSAASGSSTRSKATDAKGPLDQYTQPRNEAEAKMRRQLGTDLPSAPDSLGRSRILEILGSGRFVKHQAVRQPGRILWFNFELAEALGLEVPASRQLTPELERKLLDRFSWRLLAPGEDPGERDVQTVYVDRYGGTGMGKNQGAGRAFYLDEGNLNAKGGGLSKLGFPDNDFHHSHGGMPTREGLKEILWGEINTGLLSRGSTRALLSIDTGESTDWPDGTRERRVITLRAGPQTRPGHLMKSTHRAGKFAAGIFIRATQDAGELITYTDAAGVEQPNLEATEKAVIDAHALATAEHFRFRMVHGALSTSNLEINAGQIDLATQTPQPRTAPIQVLGHSAAFGEEHLRRAQQLELAYGQMLRELTYDEQVKYRAWPVRHREEMQRAYARHLSQQLLEATGLKPEVAEAIRTARPQLGERLRDALVSLSQLVNPGDTLADKEVVETVSVVDVFNLLRHLPALHFAQPPLTEAALFDGAKALLKPLYLGRDPAAQEREVNEGLKGLLLHYKLVMMAAGEQLAEHYGTPEVLQKSVTFRAELENRPLDLVYKARLDQRLNELIDSDDRELIRSEVDAMIASSHRKVNTLLTQGGQRPLANGGLELQRRTVAGVDYSVLAFPEKDRRKVRAAFPVTGDDASGFVLPHLDGQPRLWRHQLDSLRYRFTTDGWKSWSEAPGRIEGGQVLFDVPMLPDPYAGQLEGVFRCESDAGLWLKDAGSNFRGYTFAIPDPVELRKLTEAA
jgi:hypothetical protein